jgi:steroid Delta-isomerase
MARGHVEQDLVGLMELYAEESVLESSAILVLEKNTLGILRGKSEIRLHFESLFRMLGEGVRSWRCFSPFCMNDCGRIVWEYPSHWPSGDQLEVVHSADTRNGLIVHHRMYWGWRSFHTLVAEIFRL